ncbi:MAG TPA: N-acyl homoserine lactonase family protein [Candidatus Limnocylindria bacterium]
MRASDILPIHVADVTYPEEHPLAGQTGPVLVFAIRLPEGVVLVDTGLVRGNALVDAAYTPRAREIRDALSEASVSPDDVRLIVNTHLHFDHAGQNRAFPGVPIVVQDAEWDHAWEEGSPASEWVDFDGAHYVRVSGDREVAPGVRVLATPGHTPGHQSVTVATDDGAVLLVGQAAQDARAFATGEADASIARLRALNAERIHFSHDRAVLRRSERHAG